MVIIRPESSSLVEVLDRILDKGLVIDANVRISLVGDTDLLAINATIILGSFRTAAKIGLDFPEGIDGINFDLPAWQALLTKLPCPMCGKEWRAHDLKNEGCPWCGWNMKTDDFFTKWT